MQQRDQFQIFRNFFEQKFSFIPGKKINMENEAYKQLSPKMIKQISVDVARGLWRFYPLFQLPIDSCQVLQQIFVRFFLTLWINLPQHLQQKYFQSVTDSFEVVFAAYFRFENFDLFFSAFDVDKETVVDFQLVFDKPEKVFHLSICWAIHLADKTDFNLSFFTRVGKKVVYWMNKDKIVHKIMQNMNDDEMSGFLMKHTVSCCLHSTRSFRLSAILTQAMMCLSFDNQAKLIARLTLVGARVYSPHLFPIDDPGYEQKFKLAIERVPEQCEDLTYTINDILTHALDELLKIKENENTLIELIKEFVDKN
ncbi:Conserved_hypothetical protein [Hexamita inflata]|uniref:Uncharacterized protein n=1 Tax=Hexamita inflata TaxID=28002 RepID=A0AA86RKY4_9EUKA|nr:Conserved hypothetical protein [Hexamita inflata]